MINDSQYRKSWSFFPTGVSILATQDDNKNYLKSKTFILEHKKPMSVLIPPNYANAHLCLSQNCVFHYKWRYKGKYPDVRKQVSFKWNEPKFKVKWPIKNPIISNRDKKTKFLWKKEVFW